MSFKDRIAAQNRILEREMQRRRVREVKHVVEIGVSIKTFDDRSALGRAPDAPNGPLVAAKQANFLGTGVTIEGALTSAFNAALTFAHSEGASTVPEEAPDIVQPGDRNFPKRLQ